MSGAPLTGRRRLCTDTQGVALGYGGVALSGRHIPHKIRHLAAELCNEPCGASTVAHFACKVRRTNLWRIMQRIQFSPHFHLRAPHFASKVSYSASPQLATMLRCFAPSLISVSERGSCDNRLWGVRRPSLGRATTVSGPCDDRLWDVRRPNTVPRSLSNRSFVPKHPFSVLSPRRAALFFYFYPAENISEDGKSNVNGSFNTIFTPFRLTIDK